MATYLSLMRWTTQGIAAVKDSPNRLEAAKRAVELAGGKIVGFYLLMGQYDAASIIEAPDDETLARIVLSIGSKGSLRMETVRAFTEDEYRKIIPSIP